MMGLIEALFDVGYLGLIIALGTRLLLEKGKEPKLYGIMALLLGFGDAFHLIPRVLAQLSENGFEKYFYALSIGQLITGITMTFFYVLFYIYYRQRSNDKSKYKAIIVGVLVFIRLIMLALPQNNFGGEGNYLFGILRSIPFAILGGFIIAWCYMKRNNEGLKYTSLCIFISFICYLIVVVGSHFVSALGAFMIPKTVAYIFLVVIGYKYFIKEFKMTNLINISIVFGILGLISGVFYREFTKFFSYENITSLNFMHFHLIVLGSIFYLVLFAISKNFEDINKIKLPLIIYNVGLAWTVVSFAVRGIYTITSNGATLFPDAALSGIAGIGHILLGVGFIYVLLIISKIYIVNNKHEQA